MQEPARPMISDVLTADGRVIQIRPVRAEDAPALERLYEDVRPESRHSRFFCLGTHQIAAEVGRLTRDAAQDHLALVAEESGHHIGVASYEQIDAAQADFAVLVADESHGRGVGTLLVEQLAAHARGHGIAALVDDVHIPITVGSPVPKQPNKN